MADGALIPARQAPTAVCVSCRTAMERVERCDCGESLIVDVRKQRGRTYLRQAAWGSDERQHRLQMKGRGQAVGYGSVLLVLVWLAVKELMSAPHRSVVPAFVVMVVGTLSSGLVGLATYLRRERQRRQALRPYGAPSAPSLAAVGGGKRARFGVAEGEAFRSPLRDQPCLAFEITLRTERPEQASKDLLWREGRTEGFTVRLDDGETAVVPAGPIRLSRATDSARVSHEAARARLPIELRDEAEIGLPCVPSDAAFEHVIRPGDRVAVV